MNKFIITGNLVNDPEAFTTQNGVSRSLFRVAVRRKFKNSQGEHEADFVSVVTWRNLADFCNRYLKKGAKVAVEGAMQERAYTAKDGSKRYVWELNAENVEALERLEKNNAPAQNDASDDFMEISDDELPFA